MSETSTKKKTPVAQFVTCGALLVLILAVVKATAQLPFMIDGSPGPRFMPLIISGLIGILTILYAIESLATNEGGKMPTREELKRPAIYVVLSFFLIVLWENLGALLTVILIAALELRVLEEMTWKKSVCVAVFISLASCAVFDFVLGVPLPLGILKDFIYNL
jgi:cell division protein FtsW (lipid II flippase)